MDSGARSCSDCKILACAKGSAAYPPFCPTKAQAASGGDACASSYDGDGLAAAIMGAASQVGTEAFDRRWCRVEETIAFFRAMGWRRIGIASCAGLHAEARIFARILEAKGFEPVAVCCKVGALPKSRFDAPESCCDFGAVSCNPIMQARALADAGTQANVAIGLCVGHDMLFARHSAAPLTTLVAKDRALFHNPVGALYAAETSSFYSTLLKPDGRGCC